MQCVFFYSDSKDFEFLELLSSLWSAELNLHPVSFLLSPQLPAAGVYLNTVVQVKPISPCLSRTLSRHSLVSLSLFLWHTFLYVPSSDLNSDGWWECKRTGWYKDGGIFLPFNSNFQAPFISFSLYPFSCGTERSIVSLPSTQHPYFMVPMQMLFVAWI